MRWTGSGGGRHVGLRDLHIAIEFLSMIPMSRTHLIDLRCGEGEGKVEVEGGGVAVVGDEVGKTHFLLVIASYHYHLSPH
jgi:hypothetical protein